jgi:CHAD domain-containing protein
MQKDVRDIKAGPWAVQILRKHFENFSEHEKNIPADAEIEPLHKTRVALRRLRTAMRVFGTVVELPQAVSDKRVGAMVRRLGAVRDLDVFKIHVEACRGACDSLLQSIKLDDISQFLSVLRAREFKKLKKDIGSRSYQEFAEAFRAWLDRPRCNSLVAERGLRTLLPHFMLPWVNALYLHPGLYAGLDAHGRPLKRAPDANFLRTHDAAMHSLRRHIKRTRYAMEFFQEFYPEKFRNTIKPLEEAQECLGVVHDHVMIESLLTSDFDPNWQMRSAFAAQFFGRQKQKYWKQWQAIQKHLLSPDFQNTGFHQIISEGAEYLKKTEP